LKNGTNPIIVALDVDNADEALQLVEKIGPGTDFYKVGLELYAAAGMDIVRRLSKLGKRVFLDLKMYDIRETVKRATREICKNEAIHFLTVHGSKAVMEAAVEGRGSSAVNILAVTVLTSFDQGDLTDLGYDMPVSNLVQLLARKGVEAGVDGFVCSPLEVSGVRSVIGFERKIVTPGVRSGGASAGDQKRVATPAQAIQSGADYLVIGRQVTRAADPQAACEQILSEIRG
jgi:orotidine-5'-phosphate decarboxylase